jgi:hypothetical protein
MQIPSKTYFVTPEELKTQDYTHYVEWVSEVWRLNDLRNKQLQK